MIVKVFSVTLEIKVIWETHLDISDKPSILRVDVMDPARAAMLHSALDGHGKIPVLGSPLPPFWHWIYCWEAVRPAETGEDGHRKPGGFLPDLHMDQRMWAAGRLDIKKPIVIGEVMTRYSTVEKLEEKQGRSGALKLLTIRHDILQSGLAIVERQQLVYREAQRGKINNKLFELPAGAECQLEMTFDEVMLFRYSALTFNSHRIHYDVDYCRHSAGYPSLVVHGPLLATLLAQVAVKVGGDFTTFEYRASSPAFSGQSVKFSAAQENGGLSLYAYQEGGPLYMQASARR